MLAFAHSCLTLFKFGSPDEISAAIENGVALCGFLGEECVTPAMTPEIQELHSRYYEPLAAVVPRVEDLLLGPAMRKLLFMAPAREVDSLLRPHWDAALMGSGAACMQAVPDMLEVSEIESSHLRQIPPQEPPLNTAKYTRNI